MKETWTKKEQINKLRAYNKEVFPIQASLSKEEWDFILNSIDISSDEDFINYQHVSNYTYCIKLNDSRANKGRFAFGNKVNPKLFKEICEPVFNSASIDIKPKDGFNYYGIGWDINEKIIKTYELSEDFKSIFCIEYTINDKRNKCSFLKEKLYNVGVRTTYMNKDNKSIKQINVTNKLSNNVINQFPTAQRHIDDMSKLGFFIDTYSVYDDNINIYFE